MLVENKKGHFSFVKGISPYSGGAVASPGYEIEHVRLAPAVPLRQGFDRIQSHLRSLKVSPQQLCGIELRSPKPFTFRGFGEFNAGYVDVLKSWGILQDGLNPVARTNVAPEVDPPAEPSMYGFSYTVPSQEKRPTFVIAGAGELPEGSLDPHDLIRPGETSADALLEKARFVMGLMEGRLFGLGCEWPQVTAIDIYTVHPIDKIVTAEILPRAGKAAHQGLTWYYTRPPITGIEFEMDMRGCRRELVLQG